MSKDTDNTDEKINNAITDVLRDYKKPQDKSNIQQVDGDTTIYIIPVKLLGHNGNGLYFVHPSSEIYPVNSKLKPQYSTAYVIPQDPKDPDDYTNINYIDVPKDFRGKGIASKLLEAVEEWCRTQPNFTLIRLENDTDINKDTGLPSTLYEKAGYHYLNASVEFKFGDKIINRSAGNEMEKILKNGSHSQDCQFRNGSTPETKSITEVETKEDEELVCIKSEKKKRDHWKHIDPKNMIGKIDTLVLRSGTIVDKPVAKLRFSRRVKGFRSRSKVKSKTYKSKLKCKRSRSKVKVNTSRSRSKLRNKSKRIKV
jgi:GNAT superfamily N-acetyltransferase